MKKNGLLILILVSLASLVWADASVTLKSPSHGQRFGDCSSITFEADATTTSSRIKEVRLYVNDVSKGRATKAPYNVTWENAPSGNHKIYMKVKDGDNTEAYSDTIYIKVGDVVANDLALNGSFGCEGLTNWIGYTGGPAIVDFLIQDDGLFDDSYYLWVNIDDPGTDNWHVQLQQNFALVSGHTYSISFMAMADDARSVRMDFQQIPEPWQVWYTEHIELTDEPALYGPYVYECDVDDKCYFKFNMGGNEIDCYYDKIQIIDEHYASVKATRFERTGLTSYTLFNAYPNPFNPTTTIPFELSKAGHVSISIFDVAGRLVSNLTDQTYTAGSYEVTWNGTNQSGLTSPSGVYFVKMNVDNGQQLTRKMILMK